MLMGRDIVFPKNNHELRPLYKKTARLSNLAVFDKLTITPA